MKEKIKLAIVFIIGITISVIINVSAATVIAGSEVSYTSNGNTTVNGALSNLDSKISTMSTTRTTLKNAFTTGVVKAVVFSTTIGKAAGSKVSITATAQTGYTFVTWLQCHTSGWVEPVYASANLEEETPLWVASNRETSGTGTVYCEALYRKNY